MMIMKISPLDNHSRGNDMKTSVADVLPFHKQKTNLTISSLIAFEMMQVLVTKFPL